MNANANVIEVTDATFEQVVIEGSKERPVVVDLWAIVVRSVQDARTLLEKVAAERAGAFLLAKLDVDANPMVAQALGVQSIPTVVAFSNGEPVNGFVGAYPEEAVNQFVDLVVPSAGRARRRRGAGGGRGRATSPVPRRTTATRSRRTPRTATPRWAWAGSSWSAGTSTRPGRSSRPFVPDPDAERVSSLRPA